MTADLIPPPERVHSSRHYPVTTESIRVVVYICQMLLDAAAIVLAFSISDFFRHGEWGVSTDTTAALIMLPLFLVIAFYARAYSYEGVATRLGIGRVTTSLALAICFNILAAFAVKEGDNLSRLVLFSGAGLAVVFLIIERIIVANIVRNRLGTRFIRRILILDGVTIDQPHHGFEVIDIADHGVSPDPNDPHALHRISTLLFGADRVIVSSVPARRENWSLYLKGIGCNGEILLPELNAIGQLNQHDGTTLVGVPVSAGPLDVRSRVLKRTFDLAITVPAIIALTPALIAIAVAVKLTSNGPVFFRQRRMGRGNRLFDVYKFRSMRVESSDLSGARSASRDDDRITPVGRILRRTSLDELPQLLNVLEGDMSLVGPRPHALGSLAGDELFWHVDRRYWLRHAIKPGITGLAQVRGYRGATDHRDDLTQRLQADLEYVSDWSLMRDITILTRTALVLVHNKAY